MVEAAKEALGFAEGKSLADVRRDKLLQLALVKLIEIVGEAASRLTPSARESIPQLPWADIITMRNRLVHAYFDISATAVWQTVHEDLPPLVELLETVLKDSEHAFKP